MNQVFLPSRTGEFVKVFIPSFELFTHAYCTESLYGHMLDSLGNAKEALDEEEDPKFELVVSQEDVNYEVYQNIADDMYQLGCSLEGIGEGEEEASDLWDEFWSNVFTIIKSAGYLKPIN